MLLKEGLQAAAQRHEGKERVAYGQGGVSRGWAEW